MPGDSPGSVLYKEQAKSGLERWRALAIWRPGIRCIQPDAGRYCCLWGNCYSHRYRQSYGHRWDTPCFAQV